MSSDNEVVIASFPFKNGEPGERYYKVAHCTAMENCDLTSKWPHEISYLNRVAYFKNAPTFYKPENARTCAQAIYDDIIDTGGIVEYGINEYFHDDPMLDMTKREADEKLLHYYKQRKN